ncbi:MAG TPA: BON domain-containing protein [Rhodanobacter sp.]|nr:BON domain-containing protein [Rhodanobacter sp.]
MNDKELCRNVLDELDFEPSIDAANIGVTAENGVLTLTGHVPAYAQKTAAERSAWRVKGVKAIAQEIDVRLPSDKKVNDDQIALRAINILAWSAWIPDGAARVKVADGWVTLTGQVNWNYQRNAAEAEVRKLSGVIGVINRITLMPTTQVVDVRQHILDALKRHALVKASRISIDVHDGGMVKIKGVVDDWDERRAIERAVWSTPGVNMVDDQVRIG